MRRQRDHRFRPRTEHLPVLRRQSIPGHAHVVMVRIVETEVERKPVQPVITKRMRIGERVLLFPLEVAFPRRAFEFEQGQAVRIIVLDAVHEPQDRHHDHVGDRIENRHLWQQNQQREKDAATDDDHDEVAPTLVPTLRNDERGKHHDEMHDQVVRRDIEPLEQARDAQHAGMIGEELLIVEPDDIVVVDVVPEVFVAHVLVSAVGCAADPAQETTEISVMSNAPENEVVAALMDHVRGDGHAVGQQQGCQDVHEPVRRKQADPAQHIGEQRVQDRPTVPAQALGFVQLVCQCPHIVISQ